MEDQSEDGSRLQDLSVPSQSRSVANNRTWLWGLRVWRNGRWRKNCVNLIWLHVQITAIHKFSSERYVRNIGVAYFFCHRRERRKELCNLGYFYTVQRRRSVLKPYSDPCPLTYPCAYISAENILRKNKK